MRKTYKISDLPDDEIKIRNIKLRGSGQIINLSRLPDDLVETIFEVIENIKEPHIRLALWAYMVVGLSIDEIRERLIITEGSKAKFVSREYIRQKIKTAYEEIYRIYIEKNGNNHISTIVYNKFIHPNQVLSSSTTYRQEAKLKIPELMEDYIAEKNDEEEDEFESDEEEYPES